MSGTYNWANVFKRMVSDNTYDEIRYMTISELQSYRNNKDNKIAKSNVYNKLNHCNEKDRIIASKMLYARNLLRLQGIEA